MARLACLRVRELDDNRHRLLCWRDTKGLWARGEKRVSTWSAQRGSVPGARCLSVATVALLSAALVAGCGESGSAKVPADSSTAPSATSSARSAVAVGGRANAIAWVSGRAISTGAYKHWLAVERALGAGSSADHQAVGFLVSTIWLQREAADRGVAVSATEVGTRLSQLEHQSFQRAGALHKYLQSADESESDLRKRIEVELLESRIATQVAGGQQGSQRSATLASFQRSFQQRWKGRTRCASGYVMEDCSEYHGGPERHSTANAAGSGASDAGAGHAKGGSVTSSSRSAEASEPGEVYSQPGAMSISSPAFVRNGAIPTQYTCDGSNVSPPLQWQNVPAKAAALVLIVIDDSTTGSASGIRWMVGDIDPHTGGIAAGATPSGGIVGSTTQGHAGYGGICPEHGKSSTIEFVLYALRSKIALAPGFTPSTAESEYGAHNDLLGSAAVTYAVYHRP